MTSIYIAPKVKRNGLVQVVLQNLTATSSAVKSP